MEQVDARITTVLGAKDKDSDNEEEEHPAEAEEEDTPVLSRRESGPELLSEAEESLPDSGENLMFPRITAVAAAAAAEQRKVSHPLQILIRSNLKFFHQKRTLLCFHIFQNNSLFWNS